MNNSRTHFRIAALQNNFREQSEEIKVADVWHDFDFDTEQFFHVCADKVTSVYDPLRHHDRVKAYLEKAQKLGIRTIFYLNCHILNPADHDKRDQWAIRRKDGSFRMLYSTYYATCLNSEWKNSFFESIRSLKEFDLEGLFFDGPCWGQQCWCPVCQRKFQDMFHKSCEEATKEELDAFNYETVNGFKQEVRKTVHETNPNWRMYFNEDLFSGRFDAEKMKRQIGYNDMIGTEYGGFFGYDPVGETLSMPRAEEGVKLARAAANGLPAVLFFAGDAKPWSWVMHTPAEIRLVYASILANGGSVWFGLHNDPSFLKGEAGQALHEMTSFDKRYSLLYSDMKSQAEMAMLYSFNSANKYAHTAAASDFYNDAAKESVHPGNYTDCCAGAEAMLSSLHTPWDFVTELYPENFSGYKVIFAPALAFVSDETAHALRQFVENGGILVTDGEFGFYDEQEKPRETTLAESLAGVRTARQYEKIEHWNVFSYTGRAACGGQNYRMLPDYRFKVEKYASDVEILAKASLLMAGPYSEKPSEPRDPLAFMRQYGKGYVIYFAGGFFSFYSKYHYADFCDGILHAVRSVFQPQLSLQIPAGSRVCVTNNKTPAGTAVHIVNQTYTSCPVNGVVPLHDLSLAFGQNFTCAQALVSGKTIERSEDGRFHIPELDSFEVLLFS